MSVPYTLVNNTYQAPGQSGFNMSWYVFILVLVLGAIAISLLLLMLSKNPKDWRHHSLLSEDKNIGRLKDLAESIKAAPVDYSEYAPVRVLMKRLFLERLRTRGATDEELQKMLRNDQATMQKFVRDPELCGWLCGEKKEKIRFHLFSRDGGKQKELYLLQLNRMLDKMEDWEK